MNRAFTSLQARPGAARQRDLERVCAQMAQPSSHEGPVGSKHMQVQCLLPCGPPAAAAWRQRWALHTISELRLHVPHLILSILCVTLTTLTTRALLAISLGSNMRVRV